MFVEPPITKAIFTFLKMLDDEVALEKIDAQLPLLLDVINEQLAQIKQAADIQQANPHFDILQDIQFVVARLAFIKDVPLTKELGKFLSDCDRLDDDWTRTHLFDLIQQDKYHLETGISLFQEGFEDYDHYA